MGGFLVVPLLLLFVFSGGGGEAKRASTRLDDSVGPRSERGPQEQGTIEMQWHDFYQNLLLKGEVREIVVHSGLNRASILLHPGAVYRGNRLNVQRVRVNIENEAQL